MLRGPVSRRYFVSLLASGAVAWPLAARAQQGARPAIGFIRANTPEASVAVLAALSPRLKRDRLRREAEHHNRIPLGGARPLRSTSSTGGRSGAPKGECDRSDYRAGSRRRQSWDR